jgi:sugar fermentation stimulation protein A
VYIAVFFVPAARVIRVGRLGPMRVRPGAYLYVGSAQRHLEARIARHARRRKRLRWHVDYLSTRARMLGAIVVEGPRRRECELAGRLAEMFEPAMPGFGSSDCRCPCHLFYAPDLL